jgi:hypothetical protein
MEIEKARPGREALLKTILDSLGIALHEATSPRCPLPWTLVNAARRRRVSRGRSTERTSKRPGRAVPRSRDDPKATDVKPFEYLEVGKKIPNYTPSRVWGDRPSRLARCRCRCRLRRSIADRTSVFPESTYRGFHSKVIRVVLGLLGSGLRAKTRFQWLPVCLYPLLSAAEELG